MGRAGRKRKAGARKPSGDLVRAASERHPDDRIRASRQPHRRPLREDLRGSSDAYSSFGRMYLRGELGDLAPNSGAKADAIAADAELAEGRFHAGELYAAIVARYCAVIGAPRPMQSGGRAFDLAADTAQPEQGEDVAARFHCLTEGAEPIERQVRVGDHVVTRRTWPCGDSDEGCPCARRKARYDGAFEALMCVGQNAAKAVSRAAVHQQEIRFADRVNLNAGLDALAWLFGLTGRARGSRRGHQSHGSVSPRRH